ncbi:hypothetical protein [Pseudonocardia nigra]|uniref:hypothetical protein n=1 Tax=Pseudonocardia nigra TaxID=1921578 RepID=UPI001C603DB6|nr:hypothetical protein [Pseudonocardia nigra]
MGRAAHREGERHQRRAHPSGDRWPSPAAMATPPSQGPSAAPVLKAAVANAPASVGAPVAT